MKRRIRGVRWAAVAALAMTVAARPAAGQDLADFDYENLAFRGIGVEIGRIFPTRVEPTTSYGMRLDLGYLGPGLRLTPTISYWSSRMKDSEVGKLEDRVQELVNRELPPDTPPATVDLGEIEWSDLVLGLDGHLVWAVPFNLLTYLGAGVAAHVENGSGELIRGTFVEDLLDSVTAGFNFHAGLEYPMSDAFRLYGVARYEILGDLQYGEFRMGAQFMFGPSAPGESRNR